MADPLESLFLLNSYANSVLQSLYFCEPFRDAILSHTTDEDVDVAGQQDKLCDTDSISPLNHTATQPSRPDTGPSTSDHSLAKGSLVRLSSGHQALSPSGLSSSRPSSRDGKLQPTTPPQSPPQKPKVEQSAKRKADAESVYETLHQLFASISNASTSHLESLEAAVPQTPVAAAAVPTKPSSFSRSGKGTKTQSKSQPSRPSTAASTVTIGANQAGKKRDPGVSAGSVDGAVVKAFLGAVRRQNSLFDTNAHQDAHEFLNILLNRLGDDMEEKSRKNTIDSLFQDSNETSTGGRTLIHKLFEGILTNETRCLTCEAVSSRDECFLDLSIDIEHNSSVTSCLRQFSASETLRSRNKFFCDTCSGLQEAEKRMKIRRLPAVLALHMKRFKFEESTQRFVKLAYRVLFPLELRLFNTADDAEDPDRLYELFGIVVHIGAGPHHGHYVSIIKVGSKWAIFDDETVTMIEQLDISKYFGGTPGMGSAYVLFYQAVDLDRKKLGLPGPKNRPPPSSKAAAPGPVQSILSPPSSDGRLAVPFTRSPANSISSATAAGEGFKATALSTGSPSKPSASGTASTEASSATNSSGSAAGGSGSSSGLFSRRRGDSTSLSQTVESTRSAVDAAVSNSTSGQKQSGWMNAFRNRQNRRSGSMSESSSMAGAKPHKPYEAISAGGSHEHVHLNHAGGVRRPAASPPTKKNTEDDDTSSVSTFTSSAVGGHGAGQVVDTPLTMSQTLAPPAATAALQEGTSAERSGQTDEGHSVAGQSGDVEGSDPTGSHSGAAVELSPTHRPKATAADEVGSDLQAPKESTTVARTTSPPRRSTLPSPPSLPSTREQDHQAPVIQVFKATGEDRDNSSRPTSQIVQTGAFAPVWERPLSKKEQQKFAKQSRRISASTGFPAGFDNNSPTTTETGANGSATHVSTTTSEVNSKAPRHNVLGKGLPSGGMPTAGAAGEAPSGGTFPSSTPKRRSTLSRALGLGFGSKKDKS